MLGYHLESNLDLLFEVQSGLMRYINTIDQF